MSRTEMSAEIDEDERRALLARIRHDDTIERATEILAAFDTQAPRFPGDERLDTSAILRSMPTS